jgi:hypothetical protein
VLVVMTKRDALFTVVQKDWLAHSLLHPQSG